MFFKNNSLYLMRCYASNTIMCFLHFTIMLINFMGECFHILTFKDLNDDYWRHKTCDFFIGFDFHFIKEYILS